MIRYDLEYREDGITIIKKGITYAELEAFMKYIDDNKMKKILNGDSSLWVRRAKEEQER